MLADVVRLLEKDGKSSELCSWMARLKLKTAKFLLCLQNVDDARRFLAVVKEHFGGIDVGHHLMQVNEYRRSLGRIFVDGRLEMDEREQREIREVFSVEGKS